MAMLYVPRVPLSGMKYLKYQDCEISLKFMIAEVLKMKSSDESVKLTPAVKFFGVMIAPPG